MGGKGSGGIRTGAGRKSKRLAEKVLHGTALLREKRAAKAPVVDEFDAPNDLTVDERLVWVKLAPHAFTARTLTRATEDAFSDLCRNRVLMLEIAKDPERRGGADHRGIVQRVQSQMKDFSLSPMGKPIIEEAPKVEDPFAEFDATVN